MVGIFGQLRGQCHGCDLFPNRLPGRVVHRRHRTIRLVESMPQPLQFRRLRLELAEAISPSALNPLHRFVAFEGQSLGNLS